MSFLRRLFGKADRHIDDPLFSPLTREGGQWHGRMTWAHGPAPFAITVDRAPNPPNTTDHLAFEALRTLYPELRPTLAGALFAHWSGVATDLDPAPPAIPSADALWAAIGLQGVCLATHGTLDLLYGFTPEGWPEGAFVARLAGRRVEKVEYVE